MKLRLSDITSAITESGRQSCKHKKPHASRTSCASLCYPACEMIGSRILATLPIEVEHTPCKVTHLGDFSDRSINARKSE